MRRKMFFLISVLLFSGGLLSSAWAIELITPVDTGPGLSSGTSYLLNSSQWGYAGKFTLNRELNIYAVVGWLEITVANAEGLVTIYNDDGAGPYGKAVPGSKRFSTTFYTDAIYPVGWAIITLYLADWRLPPGTYWVAFEVKAPSKFAANLYPGVPHPLSAYAKIVGDHYEPDTGLNFGVSISGEALPPKPLSGVELLLLDYGG